VDGLPKMFQNKGFRNFDTTKGYKAFYDKCLNFAKRKTEKTSLVMFGKVGTGKSHLAVSILKNLPKKPTNHPVLKFQPARSVFITADEFFQELNDSMIYRKSKMEIILNYLNGYDCVCLDDLGIYNWTPAKQENLYLFVNRAYMDQRSIIITTNFTPEELQQKDERITSRLKEMALFMEFRGDDYRGSK